MCVSCPPPPGLVTPVERDLSEVRSGRHGSLGVALLGSLPQGFAAALETWARAVVSSEGPSGAGSVSTLTRGCWQLLMGS